MTPAELVVWGQLAPHAIAAGTLTPQKAAAFRDLCEAIIVKRRMLAQIDADGYTSTQVDLQMDESGGGVQSVQPKAHPLLAKWIAMVGRVDGLMARFALTANGKPSVTKEEPVDEWAVFDEPLRAIDGGRR